MAGTGWAVLVHCYGRDVRMLTCIGHAGALRPDSLLRVHQQGIVHACSLKEQSQGLLAGAGQWKALDTLLRPGLLRSLTCCEDLADLLAEAGQFCLLARLLPQVRSLLLGALALICISCQANLRLVSTSE